MSGAPSCRLRTCHLTVVNNYWNWITSVVQPVYSAESGPRAATAPPDLGMHRGRLGPPGGDGTSTAVSSGPHRQRSGTTQQRTSEQQWASSSFFWLSSRSLRSRGSGGGSLAGSCSLAMLDVEHLHNEAVVDHSTRPSEANPGARPICGLGSPSPRVGSIARRARSLIQRALLPSSSAADRQ